MKLALLKILEIILPQFIKSIFSKKEKKRLIIGLENHDVLFYGYKRDDDK